MTRWVISIEDPDDRHRHRAVAKAGAEQGAWTVDYFRGDELVSDGYISCPPPYLPPFATLTHTLGDLRWEAEHPGRYAPRVHEWLPPSRPRNAAERDQ